MLLPKRKNKNQRNGDERERLGTWRCQCGLEGKQQGKFKDNFGSGSVSPCQLHASSPVQPRSASELMGMGPRICFNEPCFTSSESLPYMVYR